MIFWKIQHTSDSTYWSLEFWPTKMSLFHNVQSKEILYKGVSITRFWAYWLQQASRFRPNLAKCCWCFAAAALSAAWRLRALFARLPVVPFATSFFLGSREELAPDVWEFGRWTGRASWRPALTYPLSPHLLLPMRRLEELWK